MFFECRFACRVWSIIQAPWGFLALYVPNVWGLAIGIRLKLLVLLCRRQRVDLFGYVIVGYLFGYTMILYMCYHIEASYIYGYGYCGISTSGLGGQGVLRRHIDDGLVIKLSVTSCCFIRLCETVDLGHLEVESVSRSMYQLDILIWINKNIPLSKKWVWCWGLP